MTHETPEGKHIFDDLGFEKAEAANLRMRSELMVLLTQHIEENQLSTKQATTLMGVDSSLVKALLKGEIDLFTIDLLLSMLERAGIHMELRRGA